MTKLEETNDLIKRFNEDCILCVNEKVLFDIAKSMAIIADKLCEMEERVKNEI